MDDKLENFRELHRLKARILDQKLTYYRKIEKDHKGRQGDKLENSLKQVLEDFLPQRYGVVTGRLIDLHGTSSKQTDIIIYDRLFSPRLHFEDAGDLYVPIECVRSIIEVKSTLTSSSLDQSFSNLESIRKLMRSYKYSVAGFLNVGSTIPPVTYSVFAYDTDCTTLDFELDRILGKIEGKSMAHIPNLFAINRKGLLGFFSKSQKPEHQGTAVPYWDLACANFDKKDLVLGAMDAKDDTLFAFMKYALDDADTIPPVAPNFLHFLLHENTFDLRIKDKITFPKKTSEEVK